MDNFADTLSPEPKFIFEKSLDEISDFEKNLAVSDLSAEEVLRAHFCIVEYFSDLGQGLGGVGPKNIGLLLSALSRQHVGIGQRLKWPTVHDKAATLMFGMIMNHPFHDANKRTAYLSTIHYLYRSGYQLTVTEQEVEDLTVLLANGGLNKLSQISRLSKKMDDPEVRYISHYLKKIPAKLIGNSILLPIENWKNSKTI